MSKLQMSSLKLWLAVIASLLCISVSALKLLLIIVKMIKRAKFEDKILLLSFKALCVGTQVLPPPHLNITPWNLNICLQIATEIR